MGFCVKCGKKGINGSLCEDCNIETNHLLQDFREIEVEVCRECHAYRLYGRWHDVSSLTQAIKNVTSDRIRKVTEKPKIHPLIRENVEKTKKKRIIVEVQVKGKTYDLPAKIIFTECPRCSKKRSDYFEAVLQIRHPNNEMIEFVEKRVESKKKIGIFITDVKEVPNGIDFYLTNKKYAVHLAKLLQKRFFGIMKINTRIFTMDRDTRKDVTRVHVLFRSFDVQPGDIIYVGEEEIKILEARGERIQGVNVKNRKKRFIAPEYLMHAKELMDNEI